MPKRVKQRVQLKNGQIKEIEADLYTGDEELPDEKTPPKKEANPGGKDGGK